jgi:hypothetical protein
MVGSLPFISISNSLWVSGLHYEALRVKFPRHSHTEKILGEKRPAPSTRDPFRHADAQPPSLIDDFIQATKETSENENQGTQPLREKVKEPTLSDT